MMGKVFPVPNDPFFIIHRAKLKMRCRYAFGLKKMFKRIKLLI